MATPDEPVNLGIDPDKARALAAEVEAQWEAMKADPVIGRFIREFTIPPLEEP